MSTKKFSIYLAPDLYEWLRVQSLQQSRSINQQIAFLLSQARNSSEET